MPPHTALLATPPLQKTMSLVWQSVPPKPPLGKGAEGKGGRIATGALRPRNDGSRKNLRVIPRPVRRLVVGIRNTPAQRTRRTDCHTSDIGHWFAMTHYKKCGVSPDGRTEASAPTECNKRCNGRATARVAPTEAFKGCVGEGLCPSRRAGKSAKRRRWRMQRAGFEEVPRLADTTVAGNRLARRWAREPRPYEFFAIQILAIKKGCR